MANIHGEVDADQIVDAVSHSDGFVQQVFKRDVSAPLLCDGRISLDLSACATSACLASATSRSPPSRVDVLVPRSQLAGEKLIVGDRVASRVCKAQPCVRAVQHVTWSPIRQ